MNTFDKDKKYIAGTYSRFPIEIVSGEGSYVTGADGKRYIDMGTGIAVNIFGLCDKKWQDAVKAQIDSFQHTSNLFYHEPSARLAKMLCEKTGLDKVFFSNSGAEANECAIKVARKWAAERRGEDTYTILTLENSFHGRTLTTLAATGQEHYHELFRPLTPGFMHAQAGDMSSLMEICDKEKIAAVMIECIQGEGGVNALDAEYVRALREYTRERDILLIVDEVQTGNGRTGKMYAYMNYGITPDIVTTAKGIGGGLPIGVTMMSEEVSGVLSAGDHGSTFGANPISCAGAISIVERLDEKLFEEVRRKSEYIISTLSGAEGVEGVSGMGLMLGIKTTRPASEVVAAARDKGVICLTAKDKVRLLPALNIPDEVLEEAVEIIKDCCR